MHTASCSRKDCMLWCYNELYSIHSLPAIVYKLCMRMRMRITYPHISRIHNIKLDTMQWWKSLIRGEKIESNIFSFVKKMLHVGCQHFMLAMHWSCHCVNVYDCAMEKGLGIDKISHQTHTSRYITPHHTFESWNIAFIPWEAFPFWNVRKGFSSSESRYDYCWERVNERTCAGARCVLATTWNDIWGPVCVWESERVFVRVFERDKNPPGKL